LNGVLKPANGKSDDTAGIALTLIGAALAPVFLLAAFNLIARKRPLVRICREGLELAVIGASTLDRIPFVPGLARLAWSIVSLQAFSRHVLRVVWDEIDSVRAVGMPMSRMLLIEGVIRDSRLASSDLAARVAVSFDEAALKTPLDQIVISVQEFVHEPSLRQALPSWKRETS
jgi:hypothetical protein